MEKRRLTSEYEKKSFELLPTEKSDPVSFSRYSS